MVKQETCPKNLEQTSSVNRKHYESVSSDRQPLCGLSRHHFLVRIPTNDCMKQKKVELSFLLDPLQLTKGTVATCSIQLSFAGLWSETDALGGVELG